MRVIGVDPGNTGAIITFDVDPLTHTWVLVDMLRMPLASTGRYVSKDQKSCDTLALFNYFDSSQQTIDRAFVEMVTAMPAQGGGGKAAQGIASTFNFGYGTGALEGIIRAMGIEIEYVRPMAWKKHHGLLKTEKIASVHKACTIDPTNFEPRPVFSGRADAFLVGLYGIERLIEVAQ